MLMCLIPTVSSLAQDPRPTDPKLPMFLYTFYAIKLSTPQELFFGKFKPSIGALIAEKCPIDWFFRLKSVSLSTNMDIL